MLSVAECWDFLEAEVGGPAILPPGASEAAIQQAEATMGVAFPADLRTLLLRHDGSGDYCIAPYKLGGGEQYFMALDRSLYIWEGMAITGAMCDEDGEFGKQVGPIKQHYWNKRWIPFTDSRCGDSLVIDLDPPDDGTLGQVVDWWHEGGVSTFQSPSLREWLNEVVAEIKNGVYEFRYCYDDDAEQ